MLNFLSFFFLIKMDSSLVFFLIFLSHVVSWFGAAMHSPHKFAHQKTIDIHAIKIFYFFLNSKIIEYSLSKLQKNARILNDERMQNKKSKKKYS